MNNSLYFNFYSGVSGDMLLGSLIESIFILPAHMAGKTPFLDHFSKAEGEKSC